ncbi:hypothetical protein, partial [Nocardia farcinica]|uniref:hypothetical protein n=1 Tax=Nocardia farcinica TaxID=37329 RepID=UPI0024549E78
MQIEISAVEYGAIRCGRGERVCGAGVIEARPAGEPERQRPPYHSYDPHEPMPIGCHRLLERVHEIDDLAH